MLHAAGYPESGPGPWFVQLPQIKLHHARMEYIPSSAIFASTSAAFVCRRRRADNFSVFSVFPASPSNVVLCSLSIPPRNFFSSTIIPLTAPNPTSSQPLMEPNHHAPYVCRVANDSLPSALSLDYSRLSAIVLNLGGSVLLSNWHARVFLPTLLMEIPLAGL